MAGSSRGRSLGTPRLLIGGLLISLVGLAFFYWSVSRSKTQLEAQHKNLQTQHAELKAKTSRDMAQIQRDLVDSNAKRLMEKKSHEQKLEQALRDKAVITLQRQEVVKQHEDESKRCKSELNSARDSAAEIGRKNEEMSDSMAELRRTEETLTNERDHCSRELSAMNDKHDAATNVIRGLKDKHQLTLSTLTVLQQRCTRAVKQLNLCHRQVEHQVMSTGVGKQVADENVETGDPVANKDADSVTNNDAQDVQPTEPQPSENTNNEEGGIKTEHNEITMTRKNESNTTPSEDTEAREGEGNSQVVPPPQVNSFANKQMTGQPTAQDIGAEFAVLEEEEQNSIKEIEDEQTNEKETDAEEERKEAAAAAARNVQKENREQIGTENTQEEVEDEEPTDDYEDEDGHDDGEDEDRDEDDVKYLHADHMPHGVSNIK